MAQLWRYEFSLLRDAALALYRGVADNLPPILLATFESKPVAGEHLRRLEHEYHIRGELCADWAALPIALTRYNDLPALVLADPGGVLLERLLGNPMKPDLFLTIAITLVESVGELHRRGLIHGDLNPSNVLIDVAAGRAWLTGLGIASWQHAGRDTSRLITSPGMLPYMAPEQTGRMNRSVDFGSDLYSLGMIFYRMMTGTLAFEAETPAEWVHCHIARHPLPPSERIRELPTVLSVIVMKLLAKAAEDRYKTAAGLRADLARCLEQLRVARRIESFPLGERDVSGRLLIPEELYGRQGEIELLLAALGRVVKTGRSELFLISGYSGIGKSSVVRELRKHLTPEKGLFVTGKFDQLNRDIPYATLAQVFQNLVGPILGQSENDLSTWRDALTTAVGPNGQLLINLVPEFEIIIGKQPTLPALSPIEAQQRFQRLVKSALAVFARPGHPLAMFVDDLQWLDAATLALFQYLATNREVRDLLLIGAYRNNEVGDAHPLMAVLASIRGLDVLLTEITLAPLSIGDMDRLVIGSLGCPANEARSLAVLLFRKTSGNPFFAIQLLSTLVEAGAVAFVVDDLRWRWDVERIRGWKYTDNVAEFLLYKVSRLPKATQQALMVFACLGHSVDADSLRLAYCESSETLDAALYHAVRTGLIYQRDASYSFLHDRVQEAAYALILPKDRALAHLQIARRLISAFTKSQIERAIFEIANQISRGRIALSDQAEMDQLADLTLRAGRKAKSSAAYTAACGYLAEGATLLGSDCWNRCYSRSHAHFLEFAECVLLEGQFDKAEILIGELLLRSDSSVDKAAAYRLKIELHVVRSENPKAIESGLACLRLFGIETQPHPAREEVEREHREIERNLGGRSIEVLADLPSMIEPGLQAAMRVLAELIAPAYFTDFNLMAVLICQMVRLSLTHGTTDASIQGYAWLGWLMGPAFGRYQEGYRLAEFSCTLASQCRFPIDIARVHHTMGLTSAWTQPLTASIEWFQLAIRGGIEAGDVFFACYSGGHIAVSLLLRGDNLEQAAKDCESYLDLARRTGFRDGIDIIISTQRAIASLRGRTSGLSHFGDPTFDEVCHESQLTADRMNVVIYWYWTRKVMVRFLAGEFEAALTAADKAQPAKWMKTVQIQNLDYHYYSALAITALDPKGDGLPSEYRARLAVHCEQLRSWAEETSSPIFTDKHALVAAEIARLDERELEAELLYDRAIFLARDNGFTQYQAISFELAAKFYLGRGLYMIGKLYLNNALLCYRHWGAYGKVTQLKRSYPDLLKEDEPQHPGGTTETPIETLDLATVLKICQAVSGESDPEKLIDRLMLIALEQTGAERGLLILCDGDNLRIEAEAVAVSNVIKVFLEKQDIGQSQLPESLLRVVFRTRSSILLDDAAGLSSFSDDAYIRQHRCRSIICLPLIKQTSLIGIVYLENRQVSYAFSPGQMAILKLLASQAANSLETVRLYSDLRQVETYLAEAQRLSQTGSFAWNVSTSALFWSAETYRIYGIDPTVKPTLHMALACVDRRDADMVQRHVADGYEVTKDWDFEFRIRRPDNSVRTLRVVAHAVEDGLGEARFIGAVMDITPARLAQERLQDSLEEKSALLREVHHRVKNNLQLISSLLNLEAAQSTDPLVAERFAESRNRIHSMAMVHENLYRTDNLARISMKPHVRTLCSHIANAYDLSTQGVRITIEVDDIELDLDRGIAAGLIINELVSNSLKHAFSDGRLGHICVELKILEEGFCKLAITDDGVGLPLDFNIVDAQSLGLQLVQDLVQQLNGHLAVVGNSGTAFVVSFFAGCAGEPRQ